MKPRLQSLGILVFILKWTSLLATCPTSCQLMTDCKLYSLQTPEVPLGSTASVTCPNDPVLHWEISGNGNNRTIASAMRTLTINNVDPSDEGLYTCYYSGGLRSRAGCIFVTSPGQFTYPNPSEVLLGDEGETLTLLTNIMFPSVGGPCGCWRSMQSVALVHPIQRTIYFCFLRFTMEDMTCTHSNAIFTTSPNASSLHGRNIINFSLVFRNLTMSDNSTYEYILLYDDSAEPSSLRKEITVGVSDATLSPPTMMTTGGGTFTDESSTSTTSVNSGSPDRSVSDNSVGLGVGLALTLTVVVLAVVILVAIVLYYRTARGKGRWQKQEMNGKENSLHDTLIVTHSLGQPALDDKGRPLSFAEPFPDDLGGKQNSETKDI